MTASATARTFSNLVVPAARPVNHLLHAASWARDKLKSYSGKTVCFNCASFSVALTVLASGAVQDAAPGVEPDAEFTLTPAIALRAMTGEDTAWHEIRISGDVGFSSTVALVAQHLRWDAEEDLSRVFGDIAAHRMVQTGGRIVRTQRQMASDFARALSDYWREQQPLFANRNEVERFKHQITALHDDVERLAQRVESLLRHTR